MTAKIMKKRIRRKKPSVEASVMSANIRQNIPVRYAEKLSIVRLSAKGRIGLSTGKVAERSYLNVRKLTQRS